MTAGLDPPPFAGEPETVARQVLKAIDRGTPEVYTPGVGWTDLDGATSTTLYSDAVRWWYPRSWVDPNGNVFGIAQELMYTLDPDFVHGNGDLGNITMHGALPAAIQGKATSTSVMFEPGKILQVGGGSTDNAAPPTPGLQSAAIIDITSGSPVVTQIADMNHGRHWPDATVLPNGQVLISGGSGVVPPATRM